MKEMYVINVNDGRRIWLSDLYSNYYTSIIHNCPTKLDILKEQQCDDEEIAEMSDEEIWNSVEDYIKAWAYEDVDVEMPVEICENETWLDEYSCFEDMLIDDYFVKVTAYYKEH